MWLVFFWKIHEFRNKLNWILKIWGITPVKWYISHKFSDKWTKIGVDIGICLGNNQGNFQLHRFTRRENTAKSFRGATFLTHTVRWYNFCRLQPLKAALREPTLRAVATPDTRHWHLHRLCRRLTGGTDDRPGCCQVDPCIAGAERTGRRVGSGRGDGLSGRLV